MPKHPLDHDHGTSKGRLEKFAAAERSTKPSAASKLLQQRERTKGEARLKHFARIQKTGTAD